MKSFHSSHVLYDAGKVLWLLFAVWPNLPWHLGVAAWGRQGHEIVANLAWRILSNETRSKVVCILDWNTTTTTAAAATTAATAAPSSCADCSPLALVADWADAVKHSHAFQWSAPLHFIDIQDNHIAGGCPAGEHDNPNTAECRFEYTRDCRGDVCVAGAIMNYTNILLQLSARNDMMTCSAVVPNEDGIPRVEQQAASSLLLVQESLKFVTHFVGDIHQPLHASRISDLGGNWIHVRFNGKSTTQNARHRSSTSRRQLGRHYVNNLHAVWDDGIIEKCLEDDFDGSRLALEDDLWDWMQQEKNQKYWNIWLACPYGALAQCTCSWGQESYESAIQWAYRNVDGSEIFNNTNLTTAYHDTRLPIVRQRLIAAGIRLAVTLEVALKGYPAMTLA